MNKLCKFIIVIIAASCLWSSSDFSSAEIIRDQDGNPVAWNDAKAKDAYRPNPILFLHGFGEGDAVSTWIGKENQGNDKKPNVDLKLQPYFGSYYTGYSDDPTIFKDTRYPYLELISFIDFTQPWRSQLIDRNSSVDTYQAGDYYVTTKERYGNDPGWSDKLNNAIQLLRQNYKDKNGKPQKIILVCHSMGGLAAREYLTNPSYSYATNEIEKLILIGVPNLGSPFASLRKGVAKSQRTGWFIPGVGWVVSYQIPFLEKAVEKIKLVDIDGDAARDMDPSAFGSGFLNILNGSMRPQPQGVDYFAIYGISNDLFNFLVSKQLYKGEGDGVVSTASQLGIGKLNLKDSAKVNAGHGDETAAAVNDPAKPLLKFLDYTKPEVTITSPDPNANPIAEVNTLSINVKGTVSKEYLPADCALKIEMKREDDGAVLPPKEGYLLYPSDLWDPNNVNSVVAEFDEPITFDKSGTYTISVTVKNPADTSSETKTTKVKVIIRKPVISIQSPTYGQVITDRRPLIKARIYSPDKIDIDLSSIVLKLDGAIVTPTIVPETGGSDITISYTPTNDLSINDPNTSGVNEGKHTVTINAKDKLGLVADEAKRDFWIYPLCPQEIVRYMRAINEREKAVGLAQTKFYNLTTGTSLGTPDGGINVPSLDALSTYPFLSGYIDKIRSAIKNIMDKQDEYLNTGAYWDTNSNTKWTLVNLYKAAMGTSGSGPGLNTWTHTVSQMLTNGIETVDTEEIRKCIVKIEAIRLPVRGVSSVANYLTYAIVDDGNWNGAQYVPDGAGDALYYPSSLFFGDQGKSSNSHNFTITTYNSSVRGFFGGNIKNFSGFTIKNATLYVTVSITEGNPASLGNCHLGRFLPNVNAADFQKGIEEEVSTVAVANGTYTFNVTTHIQKDIDAGRKETWYKGWFDSLTDYDKAWDRVKWDPMNFIVSPSFRNP